MKISLSQLEHGLIEGFIENSIALIRYLSVERGKMELVFRVGKKVIFIRNLINIFGYNLREERGRELLSNSFAVTPEFIRDTNIKEKELANIIMMNLLKPIYEGEVEEQK